jgi:hypothetical protein
MYAEAEKANCSTFCEGKDLYQVYLGNIEKSM